MIDRAFRAAVITLLLVLVALAVPLEVSQPVDVHEAGTAGLYNEEHVLGSLDSVLGDLPLPDVHPTVFITLVAGVCLSAGGARLSAPPLANTDPRAPPLT